MHCTVCWLHITLYQEITYHGLISIFVDYAGRLHSSIWHFETKCDIVLSMHALIAALIPLHCVKRGENRSSSFYVKLAEKLKIFEQLAKKLRKNWCIVPNISELAGPIFTNLSEFLDRLMRITKMTFVL